MGAWIETMITRQRTVDQQVAPYMGAWIETIPRERHFNTQMSHPIWVRGLKQAGR